MSRTQLSKHAVLEAAFSAAGRVPNPVLEVWLGLLEHPQSAAQCIRPQSRIPSPENWPRVFSIVSVGIGVGFPSPDASTCSCAAFSSM